MKNKTTEEIVKELLEKSRWNRNSDFALYADYIAYCKPDARPSEYYNIMSNYRAEGIKSFKTIERVRREIQQKAKEDNDERYMSDEMVSKYRKELEEEYRENFRKR